MNKELLLQIPKMDVLLSGAVLSAACEEFPYVFIKEATQAYLKQLRTSVLDGTLTQMPDSEEIERAIVNRLSDNGIYSLRHVINATGVILHTNLGRAPLGEEVCARVADMAGGYCNLEYNLEAGKRGSRYAHIEKILCDLTGAEAAMVVNNNAGAVFLALNTLAKGKKVAISRGELVEIGGSFRVPEIMEQSGAELVEIGTTNKTHLRDYENAIKQQGASVLLKVHTSNFAMIGFTEEVPLEEMVALGHANDSLVLYDVGAAFLIPPESMGLHAGTVVGRCVQSGVDLMCFSGDKLLGSAQAGILLGKKEYIERIRKNHLTRMLRIDKLSLAALEASLHYYKDPNLAKEKIPLLSMIAMTQEACERKAQELMAQIHQAAPGLCLSVAAVSDEVGGGSLPDVWLDGFAVQIESDQMTAEALERLLRLRSIPIICRIHKGKVLLSVRTLRAGDGEEIVKAFAAVQKHLGKRGENHA